jgi:uncharacterized membrane protein
MVIRKIRVNGKSLASRIRPEKFGLDDFSQQIFGAVLFSIPLSVTEEVWTLAGRLTPFKLLLFILLSVGLSALIIFYTKFQKVAKESIGGEIETRIGKAYIPVRLVSVLLVAYLASYFILWLFGVFEYVGNPLWAIQIHVFVFFFASVGAATVDILK